MTDDNCPSSGASAPPSMLAATVSAARDHLRSALTLIESAQRHKPLTSKNAGRLERAYQSVIDADDWLDEVEANA